MLSQPTIFYIKISPFKLNIYVKNLIFNSYNVKYFFLCQHVKIGQYLKLSRNVFVLVT